MKGDKPITEMNRRAFIKNTLLTGSAITFRSDLAANALFSRDKKLIILHTNDIHSRIEPFPAEAGRLANQGGLTKLAGLVKELRQTHGDLMLLDAGDVFQGTPYFNFYGGELELKLMSKMGYDATTIGNHEFDNGLQGIQDQLPNASFPHLIANYDFSKTILKNTFSPYKIYTKNGLKVGVFGLGIELKGLVGPRSYGDTTYIDPVPIAGEMVQELKNKKCDLIICLSHLGYSYKSEKIDDLKLASKISGIDLIIGGHTHTFLEQPAQVKNGEGHVTLVNQVGTGAARLGFVEFAYSKEKKAAQFQAKSLMIN